MSVYNGEKFIEQAIESVQAQTFSNWELIIVNDASKDSTIKIIEKYKESDNRIKLLLNAENFGPGYSRNRAINVAVYDAIAFIDADDVWASNKLEIQMEQLRQNDSIISATGFNIVDDAGRLISNGAPFDGLNKNVLENNEFFIEMFKRNLICNSSVLFKKEILKLSGLFKEKGLNSRKSEDYDLYLRIAKNNVKFCAIKDNLVKYRIHEENVSKHYSEMRLAEVAVLSNYEKDSELTYQVKKDRFVKLYDYLVSYMVSEQRYEDAKRYVSLLVRWNKYSIISWCKFILLKINPEYYRKLQMNS